ncbi:MAG: hypothetical protein JWN79_909 [Gemmatimonadetes bacterium]|jgi:hypothetical protein|nr:hypothetical protein [Gemmatimonadota bacterium]
MRRTNWKTVSTLITMIVVAGCSDNTVSPSLQPSSTTTTRFAPAGRPSLSLNTSAASRSAASFTVGPQGGIFFVGTNAVVFPKGSICEPSTSGYDNWDAPCAPLKKPITVKYETTVIDGRTAVDFKTPLRFVPTSDASRWVWIYMYTPAAIGATDVSRFTIYYAPTLGGQVFDESIGDPTMRTYVDTRSGISTRRVKHFSGYTSWGVNCDPSAATCGAPSDSANPPIQ